MNRNALPSVINWVIDRIADAPDSILGRLAARRMGTPAAGSVPASEFDPAAKRVLIAPVNYSGQGRAWAQSLNDASPDISARNMAIDVPGGFSFEADLVVPVATYHNDADWQERQFRAASAATHVLVEAEEPPFGRMLGRSVARQAEALLDAGVDVAYLAHGTDARLPSRHMRDNEWSYFADSSVYVPRAETLAARNIAFLRGSGRTLFVSTPDLLIDLPEAHWCPVVVDPGRWRRSRVQRDASRPLRVSHAPSVAAAKGTPLILPTLERLRDEGLIEIELIQGVPSADMPEAFARADVMLDQFRAGSYGVAACEAMASGCVVIGQVSEQVRDAVLAHSGRSLPIVEATPRTLESVLRRLAQESDFDRRRMASVAFVEDVHNGRLSQETLRERWIERAAVTVRKDDPGAHRN